MVIDRITLLLVEKIQGLGHFQQVQRIQRCFQLPLPLLLLVATELEERSLSSMIKKFNGPGCTYITYIHIQLHVMRAVY